VSYVPAASLELWQVGFPANDDERVQELKKVNPDPDNTLMSMKKLNSPFTEVPNENLYVIVAPVSITVALQSSCFWLYSAHLMDDTDHEEG
jgi:hypothetical protein